MQGYWHGRRDCRPKLEGSTLMKIWDKQ